ncbi:putative phosphatidylethanolamine-binding protein pebp protein [Botrytis fragariae]|uniref:Putative phosphatidylethanolamine-binding protein pebp protein n=1 Tax=Botrytis fragariae TaxID=1964551 RepID=A0A8H6APC2_9HELO|nr:putative phosphatidylethanolamine-binding protein pebp protein [Botrytis fragariae]KAF5871056.1 putative phosphatidylethanolamine-binding protein pebp protein [Botrytis fragariae]
MFCVIHVLTLALAGGASAFTPPGFEPSSTNDLTVAYGSKLATNGIQMLRADTASAPVLGTTIKMSGTYAVMMVDPDIPPATTGGDTSQFLHWMQADLTSSNITTTIGGQKIYELINVKNTSAFATYLQPNPPNIAPTTHRYTQLLFNTTDMNMSLVSLQMAGKTRGSFNAANVVKSANLKVLMGNSFDVSFGDKAINNTGASSESSTQNSTSTTSRSTTA